MSARKAVVGIGQFLAGPGDVQGNLDVMLALLDDAGPEKVDLMCFPELCLPGYLLHAGDYTGQLMRDLHRAEETLRAAAEAADVRIMYGTARRSGDRLHNCVVVADPHTAGSSYTKVHLAGSERAVFSAGDALVLAVDGDVGLGCCYDLAFPGFSMRLADAGARVVCFPMAWERQRAFAFEALAPARAVENVTYVLCVNQTGQVRDLDFYGGSRVVDPLGETVCRLGEEVGVAVVELDLAWVTRLREAPAGVTFPFASDRRHHDELRGPRASGGTDRS
jgi:predicted amidohydrolase